MRKKEDWIVVATSAKNLSKGTTFTLKLKGHPWEQGLQAEKARNDIIIGLKLLDYVKERRDRGFTQHEIMGIWLANLE